MSRTLSFLVVIFLGVIPVFATISPRNLTKGTVGLPYPQPYSSPNPFVKFSSNKTSGYKNLTWSATGVPPGLIFNRQGVLSGKPKKAGTFTITVFLKSGRTTVDSGTFRITIVDTANPVISGPFILPGGQFDHSYQAGTPNNGYKLSATGGYPFSPTKSKYPTGYYWQLIPGKTPDKRLPQGMTMNANGIISGTPRWPKPPIPSTPQTYEIQVRATDFLGKSATATFTLVIAPPQGPEIITDCPLPEGLEKYPYPLVQLKASNGKVPYKWPKPAGLPPGLVWSEKGYISGTPTTRGTYPIELKVIDANGLSSTKNCSITIRPAPEIIVKPIFICARVGDAYCEEIEAWGGDQPYTWSATGMPPGMTIQAQGNSNAKICGNFTEAGNYTISVTARDTMGRTDTETFPIFSVQLKLEITTASPLPFGIRGYSYPGKSGSPTVKIEVSGGWPPYTWQRILGELPPGLTINTSTGVISGTPTKTGTYKFTIRVYDSCKPPEKWVDKEFVITIYEKIDLPPVPYPCLTKNKTFTLPLAASGGLSPLSWQIVSSSFPQFAVSSTGATTANLSGSPTQAGAVSLNIRVTDANNYSEDFTLTYNALQEVQITSNCPQLEWTSGKPLTAINLTATGGSGNYTWSKHDTTNKPWPVGIDIVGNKIQGTPSLTSNATTFPIAYRVVDSCGNADIKECEISVFFECECELETSESGGSLAIALDTSGSTYRQDVTVNGVPNQSRRFAFEQILTEYNLASNPNRFDEFGSSVSTLDSMISRSITALGVNTNYLSIVIFNDSEDPGTPSWFNTQQAYSSVANNSLKIAVYYIRIAGVAPNPTVQQELVDLINMKPAFVDQFYQNSFTAYNAGDAGELNDILDDIFASQYRCTDKFGNEVIVSSEDANSIEDAKNIVCSQDPTPELFQIINNQELEASSEFLNVSIEKNNFSIGNEILINTYNFKISKNEVSISEYAAFLNSIANDDSQSVYNSLMSNIGLSKKSDSGSATFFVDPDFADHPIAYVSWFDAARYANWLANGKPSGAQDSTTTEDGVYNLSSPVIVRNAINPNTGAAPTCWLLNESEWYTSAYLNADGSAIWTYPTKSNTVPDSSGANPSNFANFGGVFGETTPVGFFDQSPGPFGTFDQAGNVREWTETLDTSSGSPLRIIRGGSWADPVDAMRADESHIADPTLEDDKTGFRIGGAP